MARTKEEKPGKVKKEKRSQDKKIEDAAPAQPENGEMDIDAEVKPKKSRKDKKDKKEKRIRSDPAEEVNSASTTDGDETMADASPEASPKKEKKDKKDKKSKKEATASEDTPGSAKKRKHATALPDDSDEELEIDVNAPEPPSKKALRKLKKAKTDPSAAAASTSTTSKSAPAESTTFPEHASQSRSKHGIWIGNLSFHTTRAQLEEFLQQGAEDDDEKIQITRVNLPTNTSTGKNKGFAYIDFKDAQSTTLALKLSEKYLGGRNVLIKDAHDFSGRNKDSTTVKPTINISKNPPSKILYIGNLDFSTTPEELKEDFSFAGKIVKVRLATFEDSGKCKGFGFVDFADVESVTRAMMGLAPEEEEDYKELEGKEEVEMQKLRKKRGMVGGRTVTMEYGEDGRTRYKKRFGKERPADGEQEEAIEEVKPGRGASSGGRKGRESRAHEENPRPKSKREAVDTRSKDAAAAYSADPRRSGAMTEAKGKKITF